jgi:hypothetical protein
LHKQVVRNAIMQGKIRAGHFFAIVWGNPAGVGDVGECDVARRLRGDLASGATATKRQRARRVRGSAQGRENVLHPPRAFLKSVMLDKFLRQSNLL